MSNIKYKDADAVSRYLKAMGAGTDADPHRPVHEVIIVSGSSNAQVDVIDRANRDLGKVDIADIDGFAGVAGQKVMASSFPVVFASDQSELEITLNSEIVHVSGTVDIIDRITRALGYANVSGTVRIWDGTSVATIENSTQKALHVALSDGESIADVMTVSFNQDTSAKEGLVTHANVTGRKDSDTTIPITATEGGTYSPLHVRFTDGSVFAPLLTAISPGYVVLVSGSAAVEVDIVDRPARDLGKVDIADIDGFAGVAGQKAMASSFPVVFASDQSELLVQIITGSAVIGGLLANRSAIIPLVTGTVFDDDPTSANSANVDCEDYTDFLLHLDVDSTATPTTIQFIVRFSHDGGTTYSDYKQGLFASLFYEDTDTASGVKECFHGRCAGRDFQLGIVAVGTDGTDKFTVNSWVEFYK